MATSTDLFVGPPATLSVAVATVEQVLGITLKHDVQDGDETWFGDDHTVWVAIRHGHDYEADCGMDFPAYPIEIELYGRPFAVAEAAARELCTALRESGSYPLLLSQNLSRCLDRYDPSPGSLTRSPRG